MQGTCFGVCPSAHANNGYNHGIYTGAEMSVVTVPEAIVTHSARRRRNMGPPMAVSPRLRSHFGLGIRVFPGCARLFLLRATPCA